MRAMTEKKSPFASLEALKEALPPGQARQAEKPAPSAKDEFDAKVVIARSRKGRGGKTVSIVSGVKAAARETICRELKKSLGCGATIEDDTIVVLGDVADRARVWLEARGARRIVMGS